MLTKLEKQFLIFCRQQGGSDIESADIAQALNRAPIQELHRCAKSLEKKGYLGRVITFSETDFIVDSLSYKGSHFDELARLEVKHFVICSILVPILTAAATTAIIELVRDLL